MQGARPPQPFVFVHVNKLHDLPPPDDVPPLEDDEADPSCVFEHPDGSPLPHLSSDAWSGHAYAVLLIVHENDAVDPEPEDVELDPLEVVSLELQAATRVARVARAARTRGGMSRA